MNHPTEKAMHQLSLPGLENYVDENERLPFSFTAQLSTPLSLDPREFRGLSEHAIEAEIKKILQGINPNVSYFDDEIGLAAGVISGIVNGEG